ncbi:MAG: DUF4383 domain-containing protein [Nocardioidaceae bacterium]
MACERGGGVIYLVLWIYGLLVGQESNANFVPLNTADNWLHLFLGIGMIALGVLGYRATRTDGARA